jgi:transposase
MPRCEVHGVDASGQVVRRKLPRPKVLAFFANLPRAIIGLEACGGAHHWARELAALGHEPRLMPARYVRPYVKSNKHDAADAEACWEAVQRPGMRFVATKTVDQRSSRETPSQSSRSVGSASIARAQPRQCWVASLRLMALEPRLEAVNRS